MDDGRSRGGFDLVVIGFGRAGKTVAAGKTVTIRSGMTAAELGGGTYTHPSTSELFDALLG